MRSAAASTIAVRVHGSGTQPQAVTLLELVRAVGEVTADDREVVATVAHLIRSGRVRLVGSFRGQPLDAFED